ncbi:MAG: GTPase Era [Deltaproteobacteria bacterium]|nr:GTPase Era [Deltaproteobacteria bacterium]
MSAGREENFKSGFVALLGKPNVGKSTLINTLLGEKLAAVTPKPQTTRNRIRGILHRTKSQIVFLDTPGVHDAMDELNKRMVKAALDTIADSDLIMFIVDAFDKTRNSDLDNTPDKKERILMDSLDSTKHRVLLTMNKIDKVKDNTLLERLEKHYRKIFGFYAGYRISALTGLGLDDMVADLESMLPPGPQYFPSDMYTDSDLRFLASEIIREKLMIRLKDEIPYQLAVTIERWKEGASKAKGKSVTAIGATIHVERNSQKGIVIGRRGNVLKEIGVQARKDLEELIGNQVFLELIVKVSRNWTRNPGALERFGYRE